jgi:hypothetical protein
MAHRRIGQQFFQRLLVGQGIEEVLVLERGLVELLFLLRRQRIRRETTEEFFEIMFCHRLFPAAAHGRKQLLSAAQVPGIDRVHGGLSHTFLNLRKAFAFQLPLEELAAALAQLRDCGE